MSVGMSSVGLLVRLHGVGVAWGHSSSMVIMCRGRGMVCAGCNCMTSSGFFTAIESTLFKVKHIAMSNQKVTAKNHWCDRWSTTTNLCSAENFPRPIVTVATPQGVISLPSALTNLTLCVGLIGV